MNFLPHDIDPLTSLSEEFGTPYPERSSLYRDPPELQCTANPIDPELLSDLLRISVTSCSYISQAHLEGGSPRARSQPGATPLDSAQRLGHSLDVGA